MEMSNILENEKKQRGIITKKVMNTLVMGMQKEKISSFEEFKKILRMRYVGYIHTIYENRNIHNEILNIIDSTGAEAMRLYSLDKITPGIPPTETQQKISRLFYDMFESEYAKNCITYWNKYKKVQK